MTPFQARWIPDDRKPVTLPAIPGIERASARVWTPDTAERVTPSRFAVARYKQPYTPGEDAVIIRLYSEGVSLRQIADKLGRTYLAISQELHNLRVRGLIESKRPKGGQPRAQSLPAEKPACVLIHIPMPAPRDTIDVGPPKPAANAGRVTLAAIKAGICRQMAVGILDLESPRRAVKLVQARFLYYWMARKLTARSYPDIGRYCGGRDHSTVMHGIRKIDALAHTHPKRYASLMACVDAVKRELGIQDIDAPPKTGYP